MMSVLKNPGSTPTTRTSIPSSSMNSASVKALRACLLAEYQLQYGVPGMRPDTEDTLMMTAPPLARMAGRAARMVRTGPQKLVSMTARALSRSMVSTGPL